MAINSLSTGFRPGVCTSSTRPTAPYDGQQIYETDTDMLAIWNGSAWRYIAATTPTNGSILQVVSTTKTDTYSVSTAGSIWNEITGLAATITPKSTTSKVLVQLSMTVGGSLDGGTPGYQIMIQIQRGATSIGVGDAAGSRTRASASTPHSSIFYMSSIAFSHLDNPSTISATTYSVDIRHPSGATQTLYVNRSADDTDAATRPRTVSTLTLMEISG